MCVQMYEFQILDYLIRFSCAANGFRSHDIEYMDYYSHNNYKVLVEVKSRKLIYLLTMRLFEFNEQMKHRESAVRFAC